MCKNSSHEEASREAKALKMAEKKRIQRERANAKKESTKNRRNGREFKAWNCDLSCTEAPAESPPAQATAQRHQEEDAGPSPSELDVGGDQTPSLVTKQYPKSGVWKDSGEKEAEEEWLVLDDKAVASPPVSPEATCSFSGSMFSAAAASFSLLLSSGGDASSTLAATPPDPFHADRENQEQQVPLDYNSAPLSEFIVKKQSKADRWQVL